MLIRLFITPQVQTVDAQGRTVKEALHTMGHTDVSDVAIGKYIELELDGVPADEIPAWLETKCNDVRINLVNPKAEPQSVPPFSLARNGVALVHAEIQTQN